MRACEAQYEPSARRANTHTCDQSMEHEGAHHCPLCDGWWRRPGGPVERRVDESEAGS